MAVYGEEQRRSSIFIEIGEEAYKQNTVYCPWHEIVSGRPMDSSDTYHSEPANHLALQRES